MGIRELLIKLLSNPLKTTAPTTATATTNSVAFVGNNNADINVTTNNVNTVHQYIKVANLQQLAVVSPLDGAELHTEFDRQVDLHREQINSGKIEIALKGLTQLLKEQHRNLTSVLRFRVETNIALCHWYLGNTSQAPNMLSRACANAPEDKRAIANKALAFILKGDADQALEYGIPQSNLDPDNEYLAGYLLQAIRIKYDGVESFPDLLPNFSERVRLDPNVRIAQIHLLAARNAEGWREMAAEYLDEFEDENQIKNLIAQDILRHYLERNQTANGFTFRQSDHVELHKACSYLEEEWQGFKSTDRYIQSVDLQNIQGLLVLYKLTGKLHELVDEIKYVLGRKEVDQPLMLVIAQSLVDLPEPELFQKAIQKLDDESSRRMLSFQFKIARKDWKGLSEFQDYTLERFEEPFCSNAKVVVYISRVYLLQARGKDELIQLLHAVELTCRGRLLLFDFAVASNSKVVAELAAEYGETRITENSEVIEFHHYIKLLQFLQDWREIVSRLVSYPAVDESDELKYILTLGFLNEGQISSEAADFFDKKILPNPKGYELLCGIYFAKLNDFARSAPMMQQYLENGGTDLLAFIVLCDMAKLSNGAQELVDIFKAYPPEALNGTAEQRMYVARLKASIGKGDEALAEAYSILRENPESSVVALGYFNLFLVSGEKSNPPHMTTVQGGAFYRLRSSDDEIFDRQVENNAEDLMALDPDKIEEFTARVLGQRVGFEFIQEKPHKSVTWTLEEIRHPHVHAFKEVGENFETRFPTSGGLWLLKSNEGDMQPLIDLIAMQVERDKALYEHMSNSCLPAEVAAGMSGKNIFQTYDLIRNKGQIDTCFGSTEERLVADLLIGRSQARPIVLDTYTLKVASDIGLLEPLKEYFGEILISHSSLQVLQQLALEDSAFPSFSLASKIASDKFSKLISDVESYCNVVTHKFPRTVDQLTEKLLMINVSSVAPYAISRERDAIFLTEDIFSRALAGNHYGLRETIWLRAVVDALFYRGRISFSLFCDMVLGLAKLRHGFVSLDIDLLEYVYDHDSSAELDNFRALIYWVGGPNAEPLSHFYLIVQFIRNRWYFDYNPSSDNALDFLLKRSHGDAFPAAKALKATSMILDRLLLIPGYEFFLQDISNLNFLRWRSFFQAWLGAR
ncbi:hypothetical protein [Pseudomonas syringae]